MENDRLGLRTTRGDGSGDAAGVWIAGSSTLGPFDLPVPRLRGFSGRDQQYPPRRTIDRM